MSRETFRPLIHSTAKKHGIDPLLFEAMIDVESRFDPNAVSVSGAIGLCQIIPRWHVGTVQTVAREQGRVSQDATVSEPLARAFLFIPELNVEVGARHLAWCISSCGDMWAGIARYHSGQCQPPPDFVDGGGTPTTLHVHKVKSAYEQLKGGPPVSDGLVFGRVPVPPVVARFIVPDGPNWAFANLGARRYLGVCVHRMVGSLRGTDGYFRNEARLKALTDFGIGGPWDGDLDGVIYQWVPRSAQIAPHANGPANALAGDGVAFVRTLGVSAVNRDIRSIELSDGGQHLRAFSKTAAPKQWASLVHLIAYEFDQGRVPWNRYPVNPAVGIVTHLEHWEFSTKDCPFAPVRSQTTALQADVRARMRLAQTGQTVTPTPPPVEPPAPIEPTVPWSAPEDQDFLRRQFGTLPRINAAGQKVGDFGFDPNGVISNAWIERASAEDTWPKAVRWRETGAPPGSPQAEVTFEGGWVLINLGEHGGWQWAGREQAA